MGTLNGFHSNGHGVLPLPAPASVAIAPAAPKFPDEICSAEALKNAEDLAQVLEANKDLATLLSPSQIDCWWDCQARWQYRYLLRLEDWKTPEKALGLAFHASLGENFAQKVESHQDLPVASVVSLFKNAWEVESADAKYDGDRDRKEDGRLGELLAEKYMQDAAPLVDPVAVEVNVEGMIGGVNVQGYVDVKDVDGRIIDFKTAAKKPSGISPRQIFQGTTYAVLSPQSSGVVRIDTLVKTKTPQLVQHSFEVLDADVRGVQVQYPLAQLGMRSGLYMPNRGSNLCSRRHCAFWNECEKEFGGRVKE